MIDHWRVPKMIVTYVLLAISTVIVIIPLYFLVVVSFGDPHAMSAQLVPDWGSLTLENYVWAITDSGLLRWMGNSLIVSVSTGIGGVVVSLFAAYAIARMRFRGRTLFVVSITTTQMIPTILLAIPLFLLLVQLHLNNSLLGLGITYLTLVIPFGTWMLVGYFQNLPVELEEAALVDGCSRIGMLFRIVLPIAAPAIVIVALFSFTNAWSDFLYALLIMSSSDNLTLTVGAASMISDTGISLGRLGAYGVLAMLPIVILYIILQRYLVSGLTAGSVK